MNEQNQRTTQLDLAMLLMMPISIGIILAISVYMAAAMNTAAG